MHDAPQDVLVESYPEEEFWQDPWRVTDGNTNEAGAAGHSHLFAMPRLDAQNMALTFNRHYLGRSTLSRAPMFFMGGGKRLSMPITVARRERLGVQIRYNTPVHARTS